MSSIILTLFLVSVFAVITLWRSHTDQKCVLFSKNHTTFLKGVAAIVVVFVHFPEEFQNPLQDAIGSFAYIGVTIFFMISSFGMLYSIDHNPQYLKSFWKNRLASLLIPNYLVNIILFGLMTLIGLTPLLKDLYGINHYVVILLEFCILFFIMMLLRGKTSALVTDLIMITIITASSLYLFFSYYSAEGGVPGWSYERMGLIWGIILYRFRDRIDIWFGKHYTAKLAVATLLSLILGVAYLKFKYVWFVGAYLLKVVLGVSLILFILMISRHRSFGKPIMTIGDISFEIYLSHGGVMAILNYLNPECNSGAFIIMTFAATILLSYFAHLACKPAVDFVRRLK